MMGKAITGKSFGGCIRYIVDKPEAKILAARGVRMQNATALTDDFNLQRKMRPELGKAVGHFVLSWSKEDLNKLNDEVLIERAKEYLKKMGIRDTQYVVVRHNDREHPHLHIVYNRVDNNGQTISNYNDYVRNVKACKDITLKHGYHLGEGKQQVNRQALRGRDQMKYELHDAIKTALKTAVNWKQLEWALKKQGINIDYKFKSGTSEVQGISFEKGEIKMKGSAIDRSLSFAMIDAALSRNLHVEQYHAARQAQQLSLADKLRETIRQEVQQEHIHNPNLVKGILDALFKPEFITAEPDPVGNAEIARKKRKKHEAEHSQSHGISR